MKLYLRIFILLVITIFIVGCNNKQLDMEKPNIEENKQPTDSIKDKIRAMSLEEKIGQLMIIGFDGIDVNEEIRSFIEELKVGGFILFSRNIVDENQTLTLLNKIKEENSNNDVPLFLSIDEEGGRVSRLPKSFVKLPEAMKVGNRNDKNISYEFGNILGRRVSSLGFNINFAPVLDINSNSQNPVIGNRAFGITIDQVVDNGLEVLLGMREMGIIPAVKHFPGHGDTNIDSHIKLPKVNKTLNELKAFELVPFMEAISKDIEIIMVAHILYPNIDDNNPATMSSKFIQDVLREDLGYDGVVISDDMTMGAIVENYTLEEAALSFIKSGGDIALICHGKDNPKKVFERIKEAVDIGDLKEKDIDDKVYRILKLKKKYDLEDKIITTIDLETLNKDTKELINHIKR
ncbi:beta-N-acetylhexosaminidase [Tissierella praeacuta DSM 18095]|uniref:Beta-N-acetylhexosaminidase n=1 Tax=Tissierella praeacuta DSM 18095 TaxID=1123404 RepID=A0A1M4S526_9FIRM|nr:beta-N-acetylhexosaminidase [Tissierella praeacuta]SHE27289.1 beta-N-acetylhexosaminidase [Tissierella praeacuta DSM 18095]SUP00854.1 beta-hexosaminidase [Tissierella praeacuta]